MAARAGGALDGAWEGAMSRLSARAEWIKLCQFLNVPADEFAFLADLPSAELRSARVALQEQWVAVARARFVRLARWLRWLPIVVLAFFAQRWLGAVLVARIASELPSARAAAVARRLPADFLAQVAPLLDPRRARDLIRQLEHAQIVAIALALLQRGDHQTMGRFVDYMEDDAVRTVIDHIDDDADLLRAVFFVESRNRLDHLVRLLPAERLQRAILLLADVDCPVLVEIMALVVGVSYSLKRTLGDLAAEQGAPVLTQIVQTTQALQCWADVLPVVAAMSVDSQRKVCALPVLQQQPQILDAILQAADAEGLWPQVLPLIAMLPQALRRHVARAAEALSQDTLFRIADAALLTEQWSAVLEIVVHFSPAKQQAVLAIVRGYAAVDTELSGRLLALAAAAGINTGLS